MCPDRFKATRRSVIAGLGSVLAAGPSVAPSPVLAEETGATDCHAHVFKRGLKLADVRRYAPDYDATPQDYLRMLDENGIARGVLVQPSFLGTDNSYLLEALSGARTRLRGIAVVAPSSTKDELVQLDRQGVVGIRLNLVGLPISAFDTEPWPALLKIIADLGWQIEVHREAKDLEPIVGPLLHAGVNVVVDHFGRPDAKLGVDDPGFRYLLSTGSQRRTWVKISAAYRNGKDSAGEAIALKAYPMLRDGLGLDRLAWGSDWPHTQFETTENYKKSRAFLERMVTSAAERAEILSKNPAALFRFQS
jgi:predicted TIM-barrel fold metal-dependent hydrolase